MGTLVPITQTKELALKSEHLVLKAPRQLDLVLDDVRLRGMTLPERQAVLRSLARLMLEANGIATREAGDDHA